jgi:hypothetical protein
MQIPILKGIYAESLTPELRVSYPSNLIPIIKENGVSDGYLKPAEGIIAFGTGSGQDRGGINWNGVCYRVLGTKLVSIASDGAATELGDVGSGSDVTMDYSFDRLGISSGGRLYYWNGTTLTQVTDVDLGTVVDFTWVDGYFMSTDGQYLIVTELNDPFSVNPLKYGSSEIDPDPIIAIKKLRNEVYAINRYTIEVFDNTGAANFPFSRIAGGQIQKGAVGKKACCVFADSIAFVGGGRNESPSIYLAANGSTTKLSTTDIDDKLLDLTDAQLSSLVVEARAHKGHQFLYIHLPNETLVFDAGTSKVSNQAIWFTLHSGLVSPSRYRARYFVYAYNKWIVGDPTSTSYGYMTDDISSHYGQKISWQFGTQILYNESKGAIVHALELVALNGRQAFGLNPQISTSYSYDGVSWSVDKTKSIGLRGDRLKPICWFQQGSMRRSRIQRFRGDSDSYLSFARLEATLEGLAY